MTGALLTVAAFTAFVRAARLGVVATASPAGAPEAALVELAVTPAGEIIFDTPAAARKVANLAANPRAALVIGGDTGVSVQVEGRADILTGPARERYGQLYTGQFPGSRALSAEFALVRVTPCWLRYYDARPESFTVTEGEWPPAD